MYKLCTLKEIVPGSVVKLPKEYASKENEAAIILGLEYTSDKKNIVSSMLKRADKGFQAISLPALSEDMKLALGEDEALRKDTLRAFAKREVEIPSWGMSLGCDPEIFVLHEDGSVFPAWCFMPSEDEAGKQIKEWSQKLSSWRAVEYNSLGGVLEYDKVPAYWDGAQAEFAPWAKNCLEVLTSEIRTGLMNVLDFAKGKDPKARLTLRNVVELPENVLKTADDKFIQFRCSRSYNIYDDPGDGISDARKYKYRCSGGHIHLGYTRAFTAPGIEQIVRGLDGVLGVAGVSLAAGIDNPERRHTYGRAGEFRLPNHGLEYRVLSNFWLSDPAITMLVFELARVTARFAESGLYNLCWIAEEQEIRDVINNCDVEGARAILRRNAGVLVGLLGSLWIKETATADKMRALALKAILNGIGAVIKDPYDIEGNWMLAGEWKRWGRADNWRCLAEKQ